MIAVGTRVTPRPPHRSQRALLTHWAPALGMWRRGVNLADWWMVPPNLAPLRMRSSACDTLARLCVRNVLCRSAFPLSHPLSSTNSAAADATLFAGFPGTFAQSDFSRPYIIGYGLIGLPDTDRPPTRTASREISRVPRKEFPCVHGVSDHAGSGRVLALAPPSVLPSP